MRTSGSDPSNDPARPRFADTFARRPSLPRISRLPDRRAWSTTAVVAVLVAGVAFAVPLTGRIGSDRHVAYADDKPVSFATPDPSPTPGSSTLLPHQTKPSGTTTVVSPGMTVTRTPATVTAPPLPPGRRPPPATTTAGTTTAHPPQQPNRPIGSTTTTAPPNTTTTTTTTSKPQQVQSAPVVTSVRLQNYASNRCADVKDAQSGVGQDGTPLQVWDCGNNANQKWAFYSDGTVRSLGMCMDLAWASTNDGTQVQLARCNGGWAQKFTLNGAHDLVNPTADKCVTADSTGNGGRLVLRYCNGGSNQKWRRA